MLSLKGEIERKRDGISAIKEAAAAREYLEENAVHFFLRSLLVFVFASDLDYVVENAKYFRRSRRRISNQVGLQLHFTLFPPAKSQQPTASIQQPLQINIYGKMLIPRSLI